AVGAADDGADGDDQDVVQLVDHVVRTRVGQFTKEAQNTSGRLSVHGKLLALRVLELLKSEISRPVTCLTSTKRIAQPVQAPYFYMRSPCLIADVTGILSGRLF